MGREDEIVAEGLSLAAEFIGLDRDLPFSTALEDGMRVARNRIEAREKREKLVADAMSSSLT